MSGCGCEDLMIEQSIKESRKAIRKKSEFKKRSKDCPWRSILKCTVLHSAGRFGSDGCTFENCPFMYWQEN